MNINLISYFILGNHGLLDISDNVPASSDVCLLLYRYKKKEESRYSKDDEYGEKYHTLKHLIEESSGSGSGLPLLVSISKFFPHILPYLFIYFNFLFILLHQLGQSSQS